MRRKRRLGHIERPFIIYIRNLDRIGISNIDMCINYVNQHNGNGTCMHARNRLQSCQAFDPQTSYLCWVGRAERSRVGREERGRNTPVSGGGVGSRTQGLAGVPRDFFTPPTALMPGAEMLMTPPSGRG